MSYPTEVGGIWVYDGSPEARIAIRNAQRATFDDPGEPFEVKAGQYGELLVLEAGQTLVRFPNNTYGLMEEATQVEEDANG